MSQLALIVPVFLALAAVYSVARLKVLIWDLIDHMGRLEHPASLIFPALTLVGAIILACGLGIVAAILTVLVSRSL